jgi:hypothetical protein
MPDAVELVLVDVAVCVPVEETVLSQIFIAGVFVALLRHVYPLVPAKSTPPAFCINNPTTNSEALAVALDVPLVNDGVLTMLAPDIATSHPVGDPE